MNANEAILEWQREIFGLGGAAGAAATTISSATRVLAAGKKQFASAIGSIQAAASTAKSALTQIVRTAMSVAPLTDPRLVAIAKLLEDIAPAIAEDNFIAAVSNYLLLTLQYVVSGSMNVSDALRGLRAVILGYGSGPGELVTISAMGIIGSELGSVTPEQLKAYRAIRDFAFGLTGGI